MDSELDRALDHMRSGKAADRKKALKTIRGLRSRSACADLLLALEREGTDRRRWELRARLVLAMGECGCREHQSVLQELAGDMDAVFAVRAAAQYALILLAWSERPAPELLRQILTENRPGGSAGVAMALSTGLVIDEETQREIIALVESMPVAPGFVAPCAELVRPASAWNTPTARAFLERCARSADGGTREAAAMAVRGPINKRPLDW